MRYLVAFTLLAAGTAIILVAAGGTLIGQLERQERRIRDLQMEVANLKHQAESDDRARVVQMEPYRVLRQQPSAPLVI